MAGTNTPSGSFKDKAQDAASSAAQGVREAGATAAQTATEVKHRAQEAAQSAMHRAGEAATDIAHRAGETLSAAGSKAANLGERAGEAVANVGERMSSLGHQLRDRGPQGGMLGSATSAVATGLERSGEFLHDQGLSGMVDEVQGLIRRFPVQAMFVGVGLGFLMARAFRRE